MRKIKFGLIGSGWRAEFYMRIAQQIPDIFELTGVVTGNVKKSVALVKEYNVNIVITLEELEETSPEFVVLCIKRGFVPENLEILFKKQIPILCETPPAESVHELNELWKMYDKYKPKIQMAEQFIFQPYYTALNKIICQGKLGEIQNLSMGMLHGYHGISIIRRFLNIQYENCIISGKRHWFDVTDTYSREGRIFDGAIKKQSRDRITLEFENKIVFYDFSCPVQYHSFIRTSHFNIQGTRGEIDDRTIRYLTANNNPVQQDLNRIDLGVYGIQDWSHYGIMLGDEILYLNPFEHARLNDDEIALATSIYKMREYLEDGKEFYSLKDGIQDMYLSLKMEEALENPMSNIITETQMWSK